MKRFLSALASFVAVAAVAAVAWYVDPVAERLSPGSVSTVDVVPADLDSGCPGWLRLPVGEEEASDAGEFNPASSDVSRAVYTSGGDTPASVGVGYSTTSDAATLVERVGAGDLAGLSAAPCQEPRTDAWILGGSTKLGDSARLVVVNPTAIESTATVTLFGPTGELDQPIVVALGGYSAGSVLLEGVASGLATLAVHVEADGAGVVATIQDSRLEGFLPGGSDWAVAGAEPSTRIVIAGVGPSDPEGDDGPATVRLVAPEGATVSLSAVDSTGPIAWPGVRRLALEPGTVVDVDLPASDVVTVIVSADRPVAASARYATSRVPVDGLEGDLEREFAWIAGQTSPSGDGFVVVVPDSDATIVAYSDASARLLVRNVATGYVVADVLVAAGEMAVIPLDVAAGTALSVSDGAVWTVRLGGEDGFVSDLVPVDTEDYAAPITVAPGVYVP